MDNSIHKILQEAGVAKGIHQNEVWLLIALGDDEIFSSYKEMLKGQVSEDEYISTISFLEEQREIIKMAQSRYAQSLKKLYETKKNEYLRLKERDIAQYSLSDLHALDKACDDFLSQ